MSKPRIKTIDHCMDIFDWFSDPIHEYIYHVWVSKTDADERLLNALPYMIKRATALVEAHRGCEDAYPETELTNTAS